MEDLCIHKMDSSLYSRLQAECDAHIAAQLAALRAQVQLDPVAFLDHVDAVWQDHCNQMLMIRSIFLYLDRTYVIGLSGMRSLFDMGLAAFRQHLLAHPEVGTGIHIRAASVAAWDVLASADSRGYAVHTKQARTDCRQGNVCLLFVPACAGSSCLWLQG